MRIIGLDIGEKRIGVARADSDTRIAVPAGYLLVDGSEWQKIAKIASLNNTRFFVVGLPRSNEGQETAQSEYVRNWVKELKHHIPGARVRLQDESLTSVVAEERLKERGRPFEKGEIDAEAATVILQDFLESHIKSTGDAPLDASNTTEKEKGGVKKKAKTGKKWLIALVALVILGVAGAGGVYLLKKKIAADRAAEYARLEAEMKAESFDFTINPGETVMDVKKRLIEAGYSETEATEALNPKNYDFDFLEGLDSLEGYLFGETHNFYKGADAKEVIKKFLEGIETEIEKRNLAAGFAAQGLTLREGVILASVVQKEAPEDEMSTVAQVFLSRLQNGIPLGSDVTVSYALDTIDPDRNTYTDNSSALAVDSCYNTRVNAGLPCGAISNPGLSALLAVAMPADTSYLYFLTGDDGLMYYSYTEAEHIQNIYDHCQNLCNVSL